MRPPSLNICNQSSVWPPSGAPCLLCVCLGAPPGLSLAPSLGFCFPPSAERRLSGGTTVSSPAALPLNLLLDFVIRRLEGKKWGVKSGASAAESLPLNVKMNLKNVKIVYFFYSRWWQSPLLKTLFTSALQEASSFRQFHELNYLVSYLWEFPNKCTNSVATQLTWCH